MYRLLLVLCLLFSTNQVMQAQVAKDSEAYKLIIKNDSLLFERSFNNCEIEVLETLLSEDLEFYHDKSGILLTKRKFIDNFKNGICGNPTFKSRRALVKGTTKVYELKDNNKVYGLIQQGEHRFYESNNGAPEVAGSIAKFTHLWILEDDGIYRLKRALSFDHKMPDFLENKAQIALTANELSKFQGNYSAPKTGDVVVNIVENQLILIAGNDKISLTPISPLRFAVANAPLEFEFMLVDSIITGFKVYENGSVVEKVHKVQ